MKKILDVHQLYCSYGEKEVLSGITFSIHAGEKLVILGPNGGGKSTLLYCIAGIKSPSSGSIHYYGNKYIGYVPQYSTHNTTMLISVLDVVLLGHTALFMSKKKKTINKEYAYHLLSLVGLENKVTHLFTSLSGGEKQRVLLARALFSKPELLLLDEPTASIDPKSRFCFYELLSRLDNTISIIMTTHDINAIDNSFTRLAVVDKTIEIYDTIALNKNILHKLYGSHHTHLCGIGTFVDRILPQG